MYMCMCVHTCGICALYAAYEYICNREGPRVRGPPGTGQEVVPGETVAPREEARRLGLGANHVGEGAEQGGEVALQLVQPLPDVDAVGPAERRGGGHWFGRC